MNSEEGKDQGAIRIATAPVSYGVFGYVSGDGSMEPTALLRTMREAGYAARELGPPGYFGSPEQARDVVAETVLSVAGAYILLHAVVPVKVLALEIEQMKITLVELVASSWTGSAVLAVEGAPELLHNPVHRRSLAFSDEQWKSSAHIRQEAAMMDRDRGLEVSSRPHLSTYVEKSRGSRRSWSSPTSRSRSTSAMSCLLGSRALRCRAGRRL